LGSIPLLGQYDKLGAGLAHREDLPFKLGLVRTGAQFSAVCRVRALAYNRHLPGFGTMLTKPDQLDFAPGVLVIYVQDKETNEVVGTARLQTNFFRPLLITDDYLLPTWLSSTACAEITRFAILPGYKMATAALNRLIVKACYQFCVASQVNWIVIGARKSLARGYLSFGYKDIDTSPTFIRLEYANNLEHRILYFDVNAAERNWFNSDHPDYEFMYKTFHPDIELFSSLSGAWQRPRSVRDVTFTDNFPPLV
jgi:hypothetical protein